LHDLLLAHQEDGSVDQRFAAMDALIAPRRDELLEACEAHLAHAGSNYFPFVWRAYKSHRASLFGLLDALPLRSTSQDTALEAEQPAGIRGDLGVEARGRALFGRVQLTSPQH
jgi:hypothetical protein